jgi:hypothetical protein
MRKTLIDFFVLLVAVLLMNQIAFGSQPEPKGDRLIGHGISEGAVGFGKLGTKAGRVYSRIICRLG